MKKTATLFYTVRALNDVKFRFSPDFCFADDADNLKKSLHRRTRRLYTSTFLFPEAFRPILHIPVLRLAT